MASAWESELLLLKLLFKGYSTEVANACVLRWLMSWATPDLLATSSCRLRWLTEPAISQKIGIPIFLEIASSISHLILQDEVANRSGVAQLISHLKTQALATCEHL